MTNVTHLADQQKRIKRVRICALLNIGALGAILAWSAAEIWDLSVVTPPTWFLFMFLLILPYAGVVWFLQTGRLRSGLLCAAAWGSASTLALIPWLLVPNFHYRYTQPVMYLMLLSLVTLPIQIIQASNALKALDVLDPGARSRLQEAQVCAFVCGSVISLMGLSNMPHHYGIVVSEASATATLRTLHKAESRYWRTYCSGYTVTLRQLCPPAPGRGRSANSADFVDSVLCGAAPNGTPTTFSKNGYFFEYTARLRDGKIQGFSLRADPFVRGKSGQRSFYVDESGIIRSNSVQPATAGDNPI